MNQVVPILRICYAESAATRKMPYSNLAGALGLRVKL